MTDIESQDPVPSPIDSITEFLNQLQNGDPQGDGGATRRVHVRQGAGLRPDLDPLRPHSQQPVLPFWSTLLFGVDRPRTQGGQPTRAGAEARIAYILILLSCLVDLALWSYGARIFTGSLHSEYWLDFVGAVLLGTMFAVAFAAFEVSFYRTEFKGLDRAPITDRSPSWSSLSSIADLRRSSARIGGVLVAGGLAYLGTTGVVSWTVLAVGALLVGAAFVAVAVVQRAPTRELTLVGGRVTVILFAALVTSLPIDLLLYEDDIDNHLWAELRRDGGALEKAEEGAHLAAAQAAAALTQRFGTETPSPDSMGDLALRYCVPSADECKGYQNQLKELDQCVAAAGALKTLESRGDDSHDLTFPAACAELGAATLSGKKGVGTSTAARGGDVARYTARRDDVATALAATTCRPDPDCVTTQRARMDVEASSLREAYAKQQRLESQLKECRAIPHLATLRARVDEKILPPTCLPSAGGFAYRLNALGDVLNSESRSGTSTRAVAYFLALILPLTVVLNKLTASDSVRAALFVPDWTSGRWIVGLAASELRSILLDPTESPSRRRTALLYLDLVQPLDPHQLEWLRVAVDDDECQRTIDRLARTLSYSSPGPERSDAREDTPPNAARDEEEPPSGDDGSGGPNGPDPGPAPDDDELGAGSYDSGKSPPDAPESR